MVRKRGWRCAVSAALIAVCTVAATPAANAAQRETRRQPARLTLPTAWELLASWLGVQTTKACTTSEGSPLIDPNGCPNSSQSSEPVTEGSHTIDPDG
jgi:hypothetical protein